MICYFNLLKLSSLCFLKVDKFAFVFLPYLLTTTSHNDLNFHKVHQSLLNVISLQQSCQDNPVLHYIF